MSSRVRLILRCLLLLSLSAAPIALGQSATQPARAGKAVVIPLEGDIDDYTLTMLRDRFSRARALGADTIILKINSYGGLALAGLDISRFIKQQSDLHVIAYVHEKAISAGSMIAVACNEIVMEPHALIGDSGVIRGDGQELTGTMQAKAESPIVEDFYDSARRNGHPELLLRGMVQAGIVIHFVENPETGERRFVEPRQFEELKEQGWRPVPGVRDPLDADNTLVTLGTDLAVTVGLASAKVNSIEDLAAQRGLTILATLHPTLNDRVIGFLASLTVRGLLITGLMFSLYIAFSTPGHGLPEAVAVVIVAMLLGVPWLTGYAQWYEIIAVLLGVVLLALEIFVTPGFGVLGLSGIVLVLLGLTMTFVPPFDVPDLPSTWEGFSWRPVKEGLVVTLSGMVASLFLWWWMSRYLQRLPYFNRLVLATNVAGATEPTPVQPVAWPMVGAEGTVVTDLRPGGTASFRDETINDVRVTDVVTDRGYVPAGTRVVVRSVEGNRVVVRPLV